MPGPEDITLLRLLAQLPPEDRALYLSEDPELKRLAGGGDFELEVVLRNKRACRRLLDNEPLMAKLRRLEAMQVANQLRRGEVRAMSNIGDEHKFGGRATSGGVGFEEQVAAAIAVKMLAGASGTVWPGVRGDEIRLLTMQAPEPVDDIVLELEGTGRPRVFISAKLRSSKIALSDRDKGFADVMSAFAAQFLKAGTGDGMVSRLVWAIPSTAGTEATHHLSEALDALREDAGGLSFEEFLSSRTAPQREAFRKFHNVVCAKWPGSSGDSTALPVWDKFREFAHRVFVEQYDFSPGHQLVASLMDVLAQAVVADPKEASRALGEIEKKCKSLNRKGTSAAAAQFRQALRNEKIQLKDPPDFAEPIRELKDRSEDGLDRLREHGELRFCQRAHTGFQFDRSAELSTLCEAAGSGHILVTGEPGSGKSGLMYALARELQRRSHPVVVLLAEDFDAQRGFDLPDIVETLVHWDHEGAGFVLVDALDAVRDEGSQTQLRRLLGQIKEDAVGWTVVASVREFDLECGRQLRELFPGQAVPGFSRSQLRDVAHFHVPKLTDRQVDALAAEHPSMALFIGEARKSAQADGLHQSPFFLRLAVEMLNSGEPPERVADWASPALLLGKFWERRVREGAGWSDREVALDALCRRMVDDRRLSVSKTELMPDSACREGIDELRRRGILQRPLVISGRQVGDDEFRFTHHLLFDYAVAMTVIPRNAEPLVDFLRKNPLAPVFHRQSFLFALEDLWDVDETRRSFWAFVMQLEGDPEIRPLVRIVPLLLAARRTSVRGDLDPLLAALVKNSGDGSPAHKALLHLVGAVLDPSDLPPDRLRGSAAAWCGFAQALADLLAEHPAIEWPLVLILRRLNELGAAGSLDGRVGMNRAAQQLIDFHVSRPSETRRRIYVRTAVETVCRTWPVEPAGSERSLLKLLHAERLAYHPFEDLLALASSLPLLGSLGGNVIQKTFEAACGPGPEPGKWQAVVATPLMSISSQSSDQWDILRAALAQCYLSLPSDDAALLTDLLCIVWNSVLRREESSLRGVPSVVGNVRFRGVACELVEDFGYIDPGSRAYEERRMLEHYRQRLRHWSATRDMGRLGQALDCFTRRNRTSLLWTNFLGVGSEHPESLGGLLAEVLAEPVFLICPDYAAQGARLFRVLHRVGSPEERKTLEQHFLELPKAARLKELAGDERFAPLLNSAQVRLLQAMDPSNIALPEVLEMRSAWIQEAPPGFGGESGDVPPSAPEGVGFHLQEAPPPGPADPEAANIARLRAEIRDRVIHASRIWTKTELDELFPLVQECEGVISQNLSGSSAMARELWGWLVAGCGVVAEGADWGTADPRWAVVRRILIGASVDPVPVPGDYPEDPDGELPSWRWPAPRSDAARAMPALAAKLGGIDGELTEVLTRLSRDKAWPVRYQLLSRLFGLMESNPGLVWRLVEQVVSEDHSFTVLEVVARGLGGLFGKEPERAHRHLEAIAGRVDSEAPPHHKIHATLALTLLRHFQGSGDPRCDTFLNRLLEKCDRPLENRVLAFLVRDCREQGGLTLGEPGVHDDFRDGIRARTWEFLLRVYCAARSRLPASLAATTSGVSGAAPAGGAEAWEGVAGLIRSIAAQLHYGSGAAKTGSDRVASTLSDVGKLRFWKEGRQLLTCLAETADPKVAWHLLPTFKHLLRAAPDDIFLAAASTLRSATTGGAHLDSVVVSETVGLIQQLLADHRELLQTREGVSNRVLEALLEMLDLLVDTGWAEARRLAHSLQEVYR